MSAVAQFDERLREARQGNLEHRDGGAALADSLKLQQTTQQRAASADKKRRGRRRKGDVVDLDNRTVIRPQGRRVFKWFLIVEAIVAAIAVGVLIAYVLMQGDQIS